jgi:hypothetical protein
MWSLSIAACALVRRRQLPERQRLLVLFAGLLGGLALLSLWWSWSYDWQPQGRFLFPGLVPFAILLFEGLRRATPRFDQATAAAILLGLAALNASCLVGYVIPRYGFLQA